MFHTYARVGIIASTLCILPAGEGIELVELHAVHGARMFVQPSQIVSIREPAEVVRREFAAGTRCVIVMSNGQFYAVRETCDTVTRLVERRGK